MKKFSINKLIKNNRSFILFLILYMFFRTAYADWSPVPTGSMEPTILPGDYLWIDKTSFGPTMPFLNKQIITWGRPSRGDIITFVPPHTEDLYVKRVIAIPGDTIHIEGVKIYINGNLLEQRLTEITSTAFIGRETIEGKDHHFKLSRNMEIAYIGQSIKIPEGKYFVMGDHRNNSSDSRYWGFVDQENIMGKVTSIALSFSLKRDLFKRVALSIE